MRFTIKTLKRKRDKDGQDPPGYQRMVGIFKCVHHDRRIRLVRKLLNIFVIVEFMNYLNFKRSANYLNFKISANS